LIGSQRRWSLSASASFYVCAAFLTCCLLLGGGTAAGFLSDTLLQFLAIPALLVALWGFLNVKAGRPARRAALFCLAVALVPLLQLVPLPPEIWTALPNREAIVVTFQLLDRELPWMPISVSPRATWLGALSLLPPLAVFLGTVLLDLRERRMLSIVVLAIGIVSVFVGLSQVAQGANSPLRFFEITNPSEAVGFFANRNHFAALLYSSMLFAGAWAVEAAVSAEAGRMQRDTGWIVALVASFTVLVLLVAGQAMARSRAGLGLSIVALFGAFAVALSDKRNTSGVTPVKLLVGAIVLAAMFAVQYALYRILERFADDPLQDARVAFARNTIAGAKAFMPFGSGVGTFVPVYARFERPEDALLDTYANRAHNDILEVWLEAGVAGLVLMAIFLAWLAIRSLKLWRGASPGTRDIDVALARAATIVVGLLLAHSFVDYPLRTGAMMAILAFACALLVDPAIGPEGGAPAEIERGQERAAFEGAAAAQRRPAAQATEPQQSPQVRPGERWGRDVVWPQEWRKPSDRRSQTTPMPPTLPKKPEK
jgi:O-antigen ligase